MVVEGTEGGRMRPPLEMVTFHAEPSFARPPLLMHAFTGFVDAGSATRLAADHLLEKCEHTLVATFDADETIDYRARRPRMSFVIDRFTSVDIPTIQLWDVADESGEHFLLLVGPEPDYQWMRFMEAVRLIVERFEVPLVVGLAAIPWPAPHTRPIGVLVHGTEMEHVVPSVSPLGEIEVPGHMGAMLELYLAQHGHKSIGVSAQVPHYLVQFAFPRAAQVLLERVAVVTGKQLPIADLAAAAARADGEIAEQLAGNDEFATVVAALEQQYDQLVGTTGMTAAAIADLLPEGGMPTGEEIAAQVEEFLNSILDEGPKGEES